MVGDEDLNELSLEDAHIAGAAESVGELEGARVSAGWKAQSTPVYLEPLSDSSAVVSEVSEVALLLSHDRLERVVSVRRL